MALNKQVFTDDGLNMLGQANAGATLAIARIVVGAGAATQDSDIFPLHALINWKSDVTITRKQDLGNGKMLVSGTLNEWEMPAGPPFQLRELGIMAHIASVTTTDLLPFLGQTQPGVVPPVPPTGPSGAPITQAPLTAGPTPTAPKPIPPPPSPPPPPPPSDLLYCASNVYADAPDTVTPGGTTSRSFDITVEIDRATNVTITIGGVGTYDCQNIPTTPPPNSAGSYAGREGNVFDFKRLIQGTGLIITELSDRIIIAQAVLPDDFTELYVPASHPACPDPAHGFADIQLAHDYLKQFRIPSSKLATIHVYYHGTVGHPDGQPVNIATGNGYVFDHPDAQQIRIWGEPRVELPLATGGIQYVDATHKNVFVNNGSLNVGQRVYLLGCAPGWVGGSRITSKIGGTIVQCSILNKAVKAPYNVNDAVITSSKLKYYPTLITWGGPSAPVYGQNILTCPYGINEIRNICFDGGFFAVVVAGLAMFTDVQCMGSARTFVGAEGLFNLAGECVFSDTDFGFSELGRVDAANSVTIVNGCGQGILSGAWVDVGATETGNTGYGYISHCGIAVHALGSGIRLGSIAYVNNDTGLYADMMGSIDLRAILGPSAPQFNTLDLKATDASYIRYNNTGYTGPALICSPTRETLGNQNSLIHIFP